MSYMNRSPTEDEMLQSKNQIGSNTDLFFQINKPNLSVALTCFFI